MGAVVGHVVEHVEEHGVGERLDCGLWQALGLTHVVALGDTDVNLEAVIVVGIPQLLLSLRGDWRSRVS